jgi:phosphonate transport system substrate-binding protein
VRRVAPILLSILALAAIPLAGCGDGVSAASGLPEKLRIGLIPNISPDQQRAKYQPFADYLQKRLGIETELFVAADYAGVVAGLVGGRIDIAYLGGLTYVQAERQVELTPLVTEIDQFTGTTRYHSAIVVKQDAPFRRLRGDVIAPGHSFAFGDPSSTSGSLYPRLMLNNAGARCSARKLDECPPLDEILFTGGHDATAQAILTGKVDAGGIELRILRRLEAEGKVPPRSLRVVQEHEVQGYPWVMRTALGDAARQRMVAAFTAISDPTLLGLMRARGFASVTAADYDEIRREASRLGLVES